MSLLHFKIQKKMGEQKKKTTAFLLNIACQEVKDAIFVTIFPIQNIEDIKSCFCVLLEALLDYGAGMGAFSTSILIYLR